jgi:hypothetical protein
MAPEENSNSNQTQDTPTWFLKQYGGLSAALIGIVSTPLVAGILKIAPPAKQSLPHLEVFSALLGIPIVIACYVFIRPANRQPAKYILATVLFIATLTGLFYVYIYNEKTIPIQTADLESAKAGSEIRKAYDERIVIGNECTSNAKELYPEECEDMVALRDPEILSIFSSAGLPESLWKPKGIKSNATILTGAWLTMMACFNLSIGLLVAMQRR